MADEKISAWSDPSALDGTEVVAGIQSGTNVKIPTQDIANLATKTSVGLSNVTNHVQFKASDVDTDGTLAANSDTKVPSQKAIVTYVAAQLTSAGVVTASSTTTFTNKTIDANGTGNSISNLETEDFAEDVIDTDTSLTADSDTRIPSQRAVKAYVDTKEDALGFAPVPDTRTVNGHALSANVTVSKSDVGLGSVDNVQQMPLSYLDTDATMSANSDVKVPSQKAVVSYIVNNGGMTASSTNTLTNKTIDANGTGNSITNLETADFASGVISTNTGLGTSDTVLPTQKAVKTYVDTRDGIKYCGIVTLPTLTADLENEKVYIGSGVHNIYAAGRLEQITAAGSVSGEVLSSGLNYVVGGTGNLYYITTDVSVINCTSVIPVYTLYWDGAELHTINWDNPGTNMPEKLFLRLVKTERFVRESGLSLGEVATNKITISSGVMWYGVTQKSLDALESGAVGTGVFLYVNTSGTWSSSAITAYNNTQYNGLAGLATLGANRYAVNWVFRGIEDEAHAYVVLGTGDYTLAQAEAAVVPALPDVISRHAILVGRIIVQKSAATATSIESAFAETFIGAGVDNHNDLSNRDAVGNHQKLSPSSDSTTAIQITKADGTTACLTVDTSNNKVTVNEIVATTVTGDVIKKTTDVTAINDTGIADGEICVFNKTNKDIRSSDMTFVTTLDSASDVKIPTCKAVDDYAETYYIKQATNVTTINDTGIADGEIAVFNLSNKDIRTSNVDISTDGTLGDNADTSIPTEKAVKTYADTKSTASKSETLTNKTIDANGTGNSISNLETADFAPNVIDTDNTLAADSDTRLATQKAVKSFVNGKPAIAAFSSGAAADSIILNGGTSASLVNTAYENIIAGYNAGYGLTTGDSNTFLGYQAGYTVSTQARNVFIGKNAGYYSTASDEFYLHNGLGSIANTTEEKAKSLMYGTFNATASSQTLRLNAAVSIMGAYTLPVADGTGNYVLSTNGSGTVSWVAPGTPTDGSITLAKLANLANLTFIGRITAGTGVPEAVTAAQLAGSIPHNVIVQVFAGATDVATGDGKAYFTIPDTLNGYNLSAVHARVITAGTTNTTDIQIANVTDSVDMLSTKLTIDSTETGSDTAATAAVIDTTKDDVATNDLIRIDVDAVSTTAPKGLIVRLQFVKP